MNLSFIPPLADGMSPVNGANNYSPTPSKTRPQPLLWRSVATQSVQDQVLHTTAILPSSPRLLHPAGNRRTDRPYDQIWL